MGIPQDVYGWDGFEGTSKVPAEVCKKIETESTSDTILLILGASIIFGALYYIYNNKDD